MDLKRKIGPLPMWAWILILGVAGGLLWYEHDKSATGSSSTASSRVDPATGLTYAQEAQEEQQGIDPYAGESYATEQGAAPADDGTGSGTDNSYPGGTGLTDPNANSAPQSFAGELSDVANTIGTLEQLGIVQPAGANDGAAPAPAAAPAQTPTVLYLSVPAATAPRLAATTTAASAKAAATPAAKPTKVSTKRTPSKPKPAPKPKPVVVRGAGGRPVGLRAPG